MGLLLRLEKAQRLGLCTQRSSLKLEGLVSCMRQTLRSAPTHRTQEGIVVRFGDRAWNSELYSAGLWRPRD